VAGGRDASAAATLLKENAPSRNRKQTRPTNNSLCLASSGVEIGFISIYNSKHTMRQKIADVSVGIKLEAELGLKTKVWPPPSSAVEVGLHAASHARLHPEKYVTLDQDRSR